MSEPTLPFPPIKDISNAFNSATIAITISSVMSIIGLTVIAVLIYKYCNKHGMPSVTLHQQAPAAAATFITIPNEQIKITTVENFLNEIAGEKPIRFSPQQLAGFTHNYRTKLGSGGFGAVYRGELPNGVPVAVKVLHGDLDKRVEEQFMAEVGTIGRTYHINLVRLYGFCFDSMARAIVYEYLENGSLDKYLFNKDHRMDWEMLHEIAIGTAKGIRYLHEECQQGIIHYDIKPGNILLNSNFKPKVADFGLAKLMNRDCTHMTMPGGRGTPGYAAPEMWMPSPVTYKCDVYSFGMLLFEIVGRKKNLDVSASESQQWFPKIVYEKFERGLLAEIVSGCGIEEVNRDKAERMCKVALWCVQYSAEARPSMSEVLKMLEGEMEITPPLNPFPHMYTTGTGFDMREESSTSSASTGYSETTTIMRKYGIEREPSCPNTICT